MKKIFEFKLKKNGKGLFETSLVKSGAMILNFLALSDEDKAKNGYIVLGSEEDTKTYLDRERKTITGPLMIPDLKIYRSAEQLGKKEDGYIFFSAETIRELWELSMLNGFGNTTSLDHKEKVEDLLLLESWFVVDTEKDKSAALGYRVPVGTIMESFKVLSNDLWERIENGEFNAFSIGAIGFDKIDVTRENQDDDIDLDEEDLISITSTLEALFNKLEIATYT